MSRIDEAMRRAAEQAEGDEPATEARTAERRDLSSPQTVGLAREPFPLEMPDRRPARRPETACGSPSAGATPSVS